jgi:hypothetical protein
MAGLDDSDRVTRDIDNIALNNCEPPITIVQEVLLPESRPTKRKSKGVKAIHPKPVVMVNVPKGHLSSSADSPPDPRLRAGAKAGITRRSFARSNRQRGGASRLYRAWSDSAFYLR